MKIKILLGILLLVICFFVVGCAPSVRYISKATLKGTKAPNVNIKVYDVGTTLPPNAIVLGTIYINDTGFSVKCGYDDVIETAKAKARSVGGDAIQLTKVLAPNPIITTCYRIDANIIAFETENTTKEEKTNK